MNDVCRVAISTTEFTESTEEKRSLSVFSVGSVVTKGFAMPKPMGRALASWPVETLAHFRYGARNG
jgi:hypothetical protein